MKKTPLGSNEVVVFQHDAGTIGFDPRNGFLFLDWKGFVNRREVARALERATEFFCRHFPGGQLPSYSVFKKNLSRLIDSLNRKWLAVGATDGFEYSVVCYPSDLASPSGLSYLIEKYRLIQEA
ncbi:MAG: hypothetical protein ACFB10_00055 [Salibacteraceae bacterium]